MQTLCPSCRHCVEVPPATTPQIYRCPLCQQPFTVGAPVPVAPPLSPRSPGGRDPSPRVSAAPPSRWITGAVLYTLGLGAVVFMVVKPLVNRSESAGPDPKLTADSLIKSIDRSERKYLVAGARAQAARDEENQRRREAWTEESIAALEAAMAETERAAAALATAYAAGWFDSDSAAGAAMVEVRLSTLQQLIDAHRDLVPGNEWMYARGDTLSLARLWPGMTGHPQIAKWLTRHDILNEVEFTWRLIVQSEGTDNPGPLPAELAGLRPDSSGSGFWISPDGYLVTNQHVVAGAASIDLRLASRQLVPARVVREDAKRDLALLKADVSSPDWLPVSTGQAGQGVDVFTQGFPNVTVQGLAAKFSDGKISSLSGINDDENFYQISVPVQPGNSGGPLIHARDGMPWVVGVVSGKLHGGENVNYAIKSTVLRAFLNEFAEGKSIVEKSKPVRPADPPVEHARKASCLLLIRKR